MSLQIKGTTITASGDTLKLGANNSHVISLNNLNDITIHPKIDTSIDNTIKTITYEFNPYNTPYHIKIPEGTTDISFEIIGAGGYDISGIYSGSGGNGGSGSYISGIIDASGFINKYLTVKVGNVSNIAESSTATYISILPENNNYGELLAIAGAGGGAGYNTDSTFTFKGGDAGYSFDTSGIAPGSNSTRNNPDLTNGNIIPWVLGKGGCVTNYNSITNEYTIINTSGGQAGYINATESTIGTTNNSFNGNNKSGYTDVLGGRVYYSTGLVRTGAGGSGYTGGGAGGTFTFLGTQYAAGGGGGSSYYNTTYVKDISANLASNVSGYDNAGTSNKGGYAKLTFNIVTTNITNITTSKLNVESILSIKKGISLNSGLNNTISRPPLTSSIIAPYEIRGRSVSGDICDDGFLTLSAGGGTGIDTQSFIQLSGFSENSDMDKNIVFGTSGKERIRVDKDGILNIGKSDVTNEIISDTIIITDISNVIIPDNTVSIEFEIIGAGGYDPNNPIKTYNETHYNPIELIGGSGAYMKGNIDISDIKGKVLTAKAGTILQVNNSNYIFKLEVTSVSYNTPTGYDTVTFKANENINYTYIEIYDLSNKYINSFQISNNPPTFTMNLGETKIVKSRYDNKPLQQNTLYVIKSEGGTILSYFINGKTITNTNYYMGTSSYLSILPTNNNGFGTILAIAGAGGGSPKNSGPYFGLGGGDAGYIFKTNGIAHGSNAKYYGITNGYIIPSSLGKGGSILNDTSGGEISKIYASNEPPSFGINYTLSKGFDASGYNDVSGGIPVYINPNIMSGAGGGGYTGGSAGSIFLFNDTTNTVAYAMGGGGGSSYYNSTYVKLVDSKLASNLLGYNNAGKSSKNGYVKITIYRTNPKYSLSSGGIMINSGLTNNNTREALTTSIKPYEIRGMSVNGNTWDDGFLTLSAGGSVNTNTRSYIQLSGYSNINDMKQNITIGTSGTERMRILSNGNVGIGTSNPTEKLFVNGNIASENTSCISFDFTNAVCRIDKNNDNTIMIKNTVGPLSLSCNNRDTSLLTLNNSTIYINGNVGIGTSSPQYTLDVSGNSNISSINTNTINCINGTFSTLNNSTLITTSSIGAINGTFSTLKVNKNDYNLFGNTSNASVVIVGPDNNPVPSINSIIDGTRNGNYSASLVVLSNTSSINTGASIGLGGIAPPSDTPLNTFGMVPYGRITGICQGDASAPLLGGLSFETLVYPSANAGLVERMRITYDGNVGIGTTSPTDKLDINGNIYVNGYIKPNILNTSNTIYFYKYNVPPQTLTGANTSNVDWYAGSYAQNLVSFDSTMDNNLTDIIINKNTYTKSAWKCPKSGLWTVICNVRAEFYDTFVVGNITTKEMICRTYSSATIYIREGDKIVISGLINNKQILADSYPSYIIYKLIMPISYSDLGQQYFFITDPYVQTTITPSDLSDTYTKLDFILVGGGGGGGYSDGATVSIDKKHGGGGGGSGYINFSFKNILTNGYFLYDTTSYDNMAGYISLLNFIKIDISIGNGGAKALDYTDGGDGEQTILTVTYPGVDNNLVRNADGGKGGKTGANNINIDGKSRAGNGGNGFYGGGGGVGGRFDYSGIGGKGIIDNPKYNGYDSQNRNIAGEGGGKYKIGNTEYPIGGDNNNNLVDLTGENAGGGGGAGPGVIYKLTSTDVRRTGGRGAASYRNISNDPSSQGMDYTGAGGGGGSNNIGGGFMEPSRGGCGYAILWFHN